MNLEKRIRTLEANTPMGYATVDVTGAPAIESDLDGLQWFFATQNLLRSRGHEKEKGDVLWALRTSVGVDNAGGLLWEYLSAMVGGMMPEEELRRVVRRAVVDRGCKPRDVEHVVEKVLEGFLPKETK